MAKNLLSVKNLTVDFKGSHTVRAVDTISFDIAMGETVALVGESGSGKSTIALSVLKLLNDRAVIPAKSKIVFMGKDMTQLSEAQLRHIRGADIGMIFQEPQSSLNPLHRVRKQIAEALEIHNAYSAKQIPGRMRELLKLVQLDDAERILRSYPHELSGGQRQRVMIAIALANNPKLLIADEPTTALDVKVEGEILELLADLKTKLNMSMLLITHDLGIVRNLADRVVVMKDGKAVEVGAVQTIFKKPAKAYTKQLIAAQPKGEIKTKPDKQTLLSVDKMKVQFPIGQGIFFGPKKYLTAVDGISLDLKQGETLGIVGESGSGKSTLGFALLRLNNSTGSIYFDGKDIRVLDKKAMRQMRQHMQVIFQDPYGSLNPRLTVGQIIEEGLLVHKPQMTKTQRRQVIEETLERVELKKDILARFPHEFSGGQRQRIALARALVLRPKLIVLDEPTSALDVSVQAQIIALLKELQQQFNMSYLFISHDLRVVKALSHRIMVLRQGKVVETGPTHAILTKPKNKYTRELITAAFAKDF